MSVENTIAKQAKLEGKLTPEMQNHISVVAKAAIGAASLCPAELPTHFKFTLAPKTYVPTFEVDWGRRDAGSETSPDNAKRARDVADEVTPKVTPSRGNAERQAKS